MEDMYPDKVWFGESMLFRLWYKMSKISLTRRILFVIVNSLYSFWWDVVMDWNLSILTTPSGPGPGRWGLRKSIHFSSPYLYYVAIGLDLLLRFVTPKRTLMTLE